MQPAADWRSEAAYAYIENLQPREVAWEFLRRNLNYQDDVRRASTDPEASTERLVRRWGLCFRGRSTALR